MKYLVILVMAYYFCCTNTYAASFDCQKASSSLEMTICNNPELNSEDGRLGDLFHEIKKKTSKYSFSEFLATHRKWLKSRSKLCKADDAECLVSLYKKRNEELKTSNMRLNESLSQTLGAYRLNTKDDCNIELILFEQEGRFRYQLISDGDSRLGSVSSSLTSSDEIYLKGVESSEPSKYTLSLVTHLNSLSFQNYGNAMNPYLFFKGCSKYIELDKVVDAEISTSHHMTLGVNKGAILGAVKTSRGIGFIRYDEIAFNNDTVKFIVYDGPGIDFPSSELQPYSFSDFSTVYEGEIPVFEKKGDWLSISKDSKNQQWVNTQEISRYAYYQSWKSYFSTNSDNDGFTPRNIMAYSDQVLLRHGPDDEGAIDITRANWLSVQKGNKDRFISTKGKYIVILKIKGDYALVKLEDGPIIFDCTYEGPEYFLKWSGNIGWIRYVDEQGYPYIQEIQETTVC